MTPRPEAAGGARTDAPGDDAPAAEFFAQLRRDPDIDPSDLVAVDATDRLLLDTAAPLLAGCGPGEVAVVDDSYGALTLARPPCTAPPAFG